MTARTAAAPALFGATYLLATSSLLPGDRPLTMAWLRVVPAAVVLLLLARPRLPRPTLLRCVLIGSFNMGLVFPAFFLAAERLPGGVAAVVSNTTPLFVLALTPLVLGERPLAHRLLAGVVGVAGVALMVDATPGDLSVSGLLGGFTAAGLLGLGYVTTRRWLGGVSGIDAAAVQLSSGGLVLTVLWVLFDRQAPSLDGGLLLGTALLSLALTALPYTLLFAGISQLGPDRAALLAPITPLVATVLGVLFREESLAALQLVGMVIVVGAVVLAQRSTGWRLGAAARPAAQMPAPRSSEGPPV